MRKALACLFATALLAACGREPRAIKEPAMSKSGKPSKMEGKMGKSAEDWRAQLNPKTFAVMCNEDTEAPFSGKYWDHHEQGTYVCAACGLELFASEAKFESGTGWPSFYAPVKKENVGESEDSSHGMRRVEVHCPRCGGHLGHLFPDGPKPTGMRYCINSASLDFKKK